MKLNYCLCKSRSEEKILMLHDLHLNTIQFVLENKYRMEEGEERVPQEDTKFMIGRQEYRMMKKGL